MSLIPHCEFGSALWTPRFYLSSQACRKNHKNYEELVNITGSSPVNWVFYYSPVHRELYSFVDIHQFIKISSLAVFLNTWFPMLSGMKLVHYELAGLLLVQRFLMCSSVQWKFSCSVCSKLISKSLVHLEFTKSLWFL